MTGRSGFSLVEMVIVLVLAGIVSTAAFTMFTTQNQLNAQMTALGESQENARSAVQVAATELRSASGGAIVTARGDRLVVRVPLVVGVVCASLPGNSSAVFFPLNGRVIDFREVDWYDVRSIYGDWSPHMEPRPSDRFNGRASRQPCVDAGTGDAGTDSDYATMRAGGSSVAAGSAVRLYREITYLFATSTLDTTRRAFYRLEGEDEVELAQGFSNATRFEYMVAGDGVWRTTLTNAQLPGVSAIRLYAQVTGEGSVGSASGSATFALTREIQLRGGR